MAAVTHWPAGNNAAGTCCMQHICFDRCSDQVEILGSVDEECEAMRCKH
jgi:hypothetical protein